MTIAVKESIFHVWYTSCLQTTACLFLRFLKPFSHGRIFELLEELRTAHKVGKIHRYLCCAPTMCGVDKETPNTNRFYSHTPFCLSCMRVQFHTTNMVFANRNKNKINNSSCAILPCESIGIFCTVPAVLLLSSNLKNTLTPTSCGYFRINSAKTRTLTQYSNNYIAVILFLIGFGLC